MQFEPGKTTTPTFILYQLNTKSNTRECTKHPLVTKLLKFNSLSSAYLLKKVKQKGLAKLEVDGYRYSYDKQCFENPSFFCVGKIIGKRKCYRNGAEYKMVDPKISI